MAARTMGRSPASTTTIADVSAIEVTTTDIVDRPCQDCVALKNQINDSRNKALLRQAATNTEALLKIALVDVLPDELRSTYYTRHGDINEAALGACKLAGLEREVKELNKFAQAIQAIGMSEELYDALVTGSHTLKNLFNGEVHPTIDLSGVPATVVSCISAAAALNVPSSIGEVDTLLTWLGTQQNAPYLISRSST
jgi:hypothetical protein